MKRSWHFAMLALVAVSLGACATIPRDRFTAAELGRAVPVGFPGVRDDTGGAASLEAMRTAIMSSVATAPGGTITMLALSGGGANGAYGAGVLYGWTQAGNRPDFAVVTGVSTGALIAPFAFLGSHWDTELKNAYTNGQAASLISFSGLRALFKDSLYSGRPLRRLVESYVSDRLLSAVAAEHQRGRRLLIATTNLDSERLVVWDMGAIASRGGPAARQLFVNVMIASASMPGVFPPAMIASESGGRTIHEMHVDGATINGFFAIPNAALLLSQPRTQTARGAIYVLINGKVDEEFRITRHAILPVISRSYDAGSKAAQKTALIALAGFGQRQQVSTYLASIPLAAKASALDFSRDAMISLFELGRRDEAAGSAWRDLQKAVLPAQH